MQISTFRDVEYIWKAILMCYPPCVAVFNPIYKFLVEKSYDFKVTHKFRNDNFRWWIPKEISCPVQHLGTYPERGHTDRKNKSEDQQPIRTEIFNTFQLNCLVVAIVYTMIPIVVISLRTLRAYFVVIALNILLLLDIMAAWFTSIKRLVLMAVIYHLIYKSLHEESLPTCDITENI